MSELIEAWRRERDSWINSAAGKRCCDEARNNVETAFLAGWNAAARVIIAELEKK